MKQPEISHLRAYSADLSPSPAKKAIRWTLAPWLGLCALALAGCSTGYSGNVGNGSGGTTATVPQVQHVVVVSLENANYGDVVGTPNMPYLASLISHGALVSKYYANSHPSLPNYFTMTTGEAITNDDGYSDTVTTDNVVREMVAAGKTWKVYAESLPSAGYLGGDRGPYVRHHNPFPYLSDVQQSVTQAANVVPFTQFASDITSGASFKLPNYAFVTPNLVDDAHSCITGGTTDCTLSSRLKTSDGWLQTNIGPLLNTPEFQTSGLLIVLFDESADDITNGGGHVLAMMIGTHVRAGYNSSTTSYDHRSLLSLTMKAIGVANIPNGADAAPQMTEFFK
jgi:phosphatidylinositol-3-phosphatase